MFSDEQKKVIKKIMSGHSKGYGCYTDTDFETVDVFIIDLTGVKDNNKLENYMLIKGNTIQYNFNNNFKPILKKLKEKKKNIS